MADTGSQRDVPEVDVVICTRNRDGSIAAAVNSVLANDHPSFRLTVIDQSTTDATGKVLEPIAAGDDRLTYIHVDEAGLSRAYNTGVQSTTAEVLAFTDDDCLVPTNWISTIAAAFSAEPDGDLLYGQVVPLDGDQALTPLLRIEKPEKLSRRSGYRVFGMGANFAARRRLFTSIGGFDQVLGGGGPLRSSQDYDLAYRTYKSGSVILLRPEVTLHHDGRREAEDWPALLLNYGTGDGAFYMKHVRCRDPFAAWLLAKVLARSAAKSVIKPLLGRGSASVPYFKGLLAGIRGSFRFKVDHRRRMYVERAAAS
ncbi:MAG TPA: glycosyltransferase family A protein [Ilumatobacteraceae bacterium]|nr:glycosyltransferase family A protein [Ilumatobacteraceae bacterium]